jgi:hypothetical protein
MKRRRGGRRRRRRNRLDEGTCEQMGIDEMKRREEGSRESSRHIVCHDKVSLLQF